MISEQVNKAVRTRTFHKVGMDDLDLVLKAQQACTFDKDALSVGEVAAKLALGRIHGLVMEADGRRMICMWQQDSKRAMLNCLYREGSSKGFLKDLRIGWQKVEDTLAEWEIDEVYLTISVANPRFGKLYNVFGRLGFRADLMRMGRAL